MTTTTAADLRRDAETALHAYETLVRTTPDNPEDQSAAQRSAIRRARDTYFAALRRFNAVRGEE